MEYNVKKEEKLLPSLSKIKPSLSELHYGRKIQKRIFQKPETTVLNRFNEDIGTLVPRSTKNLSANKSSEKDIFTKNGFQYEAEISEDFQAKHLIITFDNDIFAETDYYYTNGFSVGLVHPALKNSFFGRILPALGANSQNFAGVRIHQFMFTPQNPEAVAIVPNDRPFAGVLLGEYFKLSQLPQMGFTMHSSIRLGLIGKASMAQALQTVMHQLEPKGWEYQIANDLLINFDLGAEKILFRTKLAEFSGIIEAGAGTYQTYGGAALQFRFGLFNGLTNSYLPGIENDYQKKSHGSSLYFFISPAWTYMLHNASLNGGLFNNKSPHVFSHSELNSKLFRISAGFSWHYRSLGFGFRWIHTKPEFISGKSHNWGSLSFLYTL